jgi:hypothetical protein
VRSKIAVGWRIRVEGAQFRSVVGERFEIPLGGQGRKPLIGRDFRKPYYEAIVQSPRRKSRSLGAIEQFLRSRLDSPCSKTLENMRIFGSVRDSMYKSRKSAGGGRETRKKLAPRAPLRSSRSARGSRQKLLGCPSQKDAIRLWVSLIIAAWQWTIFFVVPSPPRRHACQITMPFRSAHRRLWNTGQNEFAQRFGQLLGCPIAVMQPFVIAGINNPVE